MDNSIKPFVQDGLALLIQYLIAGLVVVTVFLFIYFSRCESEFFNSVCVRFR